MSSLEALTGTGIYAKEPGGASAAPSSFVEATVATTPTAVDEEVMVLVGAEGSQLQAGPCRWEPRVTANGFEFPSRGDACLVVTGANGHRAIVWWKPATPTTPTPWIEVGSGGSAPAFQNSWSNVGGAYETAAFRFVGDRLVALKGSIKGGVTTTTAWVMPAACRPAKDRRLALALVDGAGAVQTALLAVRADGAVLPYSLSATGTIDEAHVDAVYAL